MANTILTPNQITRAALAILHQKCNFIGSINRAYDNSFADGGAQIGSTLRIRRPNQYIVRTGPTLSIQDVVEDSVTLAVTTQKGVDLAFTSVDRTLFIQDFADRFLEPAMAVLAANIEADVLNSTNSVYNQVNGHGAPQTLKNILISRKILKDNLVPADDNLNVRMNTQDNVDLVDSLKGLFQDSKSISTQYRDGVLGKTAGYEFAENTLLNTYTRGAESATYIVNGSAQSGASLVVSTGTGAGNFGDVFTVAGVFRVHPETKVSTGVLQQFVLIAAYAGGAGTMSVSPAMVSSGATQNVSAAPANGALLTFAGTAGASSGLSLAYHKDFATFATADLVMPGGVDMAARETVDGIRMRLVRNYDINNDKFPCRLDILYGYSVIRPQLACRLAAN